MVAWPLWRGGIYKVVKLSISLDTKVKKYDGMFKWFTVQTLEVAKYGATVQTGNLIYIFTRSYNGKH